jgi:hypothetical protein
LPVGTLIKKLGDAVLQDDSRVRMSLTKFVMQPTIHDATHNNISKKAGFLISIFRFLFEMYCGLHFQFIGLIIPKLLSFQITFQVLFLAVVNLSDVVGAKGFNYC